MLMKEAIGGTNTGGSKTCPWSINHFDIDYYVFHLDIKQGNITGVVNNWNQKKSLIGSSRRSLDNMSEVFNCIFGNETFFMLIRLSLFFVWRDQIKMSQHLFL